MKMVKIITLKRSGKNWILHLGNETFIHPDLLVISKTLHEHFKKYG